jgi:hypothetical protein
LALSRPLAFLGAWPWSPSWPTARFPFGCRRFRAQSPTCSYGAPCTAGSPSLRLAGPNRPTFDCRCTARPALCGDRPTRSPSTVSGATKVEPLGPDARSSSRQMPSSCRTSSSASLAAWPLMIQPFSKRLIRRSASCPPTPSNRRAPPWTIVARHRPRAPPRGHVRRDSFRSAAQARDCMMLATCCLRRCPRVAFGRNPPSPTIRKPRVCGAFLRHRYRDSNPGFRTENPAS